MALQCPIVQEFHTRSSCEAALQKIVVEFKTVKSAGCYLK